MVGRSADLLQRRAGLIARQALANQIANNYSQFIRTYTSTGAQASPDSGAYNDRASWCVGPVFLPVDQTRPIKQGHLQVGTYEDAHTNMNELKQSMINNALRSLGPLDNRERDYIEGTVRREVEGFFEGTPGRKGMRYYLENLPQLAGRSPADTSASSQIQVGFTSAPPASGMREGVSSVVAGFKPTAVTSAGPTERTEIAYWAGNARLSGRGSGTITYFSNVKNAIDNYLEIFNSTDWAGRMDELSKRDQDMQNSIEESIKNAYQIAAASAMKAAHKAKFVALRHIAKSLIQQLNVYSMYISKEQRIDIKEAALNQDKSFMEGVIDKMVPGGDSGYLTVRHPTAIQEKHKVSVAKDLPVNVGYRIDSTSPRENEFKMDNNRKDLEQFQVVPFVFLGDLLMALLTLPADLREYEDPNNPNKTLPRETVLDRIIKNSGRRFYTDLGEITFNRPFTNRETANFKMYYYPISLKRLNDFFSREIVGKERQFYSYYDFCNDLVRKFFDNAFTSCAREAHTQSFVSPKIRLAVYEHPARANAAGGENFPGSTHIFIYGSKNIKQDLSSIHINKSHNFGDYDHNMKNGIYHFYLGGINRGMALSVKVIDIADPNTKTAVYMDLGRSSERANAGSNSERQGDWAPVVFQANVETLGFPLFQLGNLIYVDLTPYITSENSATRQFAANGYYGIKKISYNWSAEKFTTNIESIIQYSTEDAVDIATGAPLRGITALGPGVDPTTTAMIRAEAKAAEDQGDRLKSTMEYTKDNATRARRAAQHRRPPKFD